MEEKDLNVLLEKVDSKVKEAVKVAVDTAITGMMKTDELAARLDELKVNDLTIKEIADAVKVQGEKLTEMANKQHSAASQKSISEILKANMNGLKAIQSKDSKVMILNVPMSALKTNVTINSSITSNLAGATLPGLNDTGLPANGLELAFQRLTLPPDHQGIVKYTDLTTRTNTATYIAEGAQQSAQQTYIWTNTYKTVEKVLGIVPVSYESLTDSAEMEMAIRRLLIADVETIRQTQLYTGSGTAPQIAGVFASYAVAFNHAAFTGPLVDAANIYDLAMLLKEQIALNYGAKFMPDVILMNPGDALKAKWTKDELGNYVMNPFVSPDGQTIAGMRIIESYYVTANTLVVGDSRYAYYYQGDNVEIEIGLEASNFTYDLVSLKARARHCLVIRTADAYGWMKCTDITAALSAITNV